MSSIEYTPDLVTLDYVRRMREFSSTETSDDAILTSIIHGVSANIVRSINRVPMPYVATKTFDFVRDYVWNSRTLYLDDDLLRVSSVTNDGTAISSSLYVLRPANTLPYDYIKLKSSARGWTFTDDIENAISVVGTWGYVPHYDTSAWRDSTIDVPAGNLSAVATTVTVSDSSVFEVLQYLRINDEVLQVTANDTDTNTLTLTRGELGTTAAAHTSGDTIEQFHQLSDLQRQVSDIVGYLYKTLHRVGGELQVFAGAAIATERLDPSILRGIKNKYERKRPYIA